MSEIPVVTIDGPAASGKSSVSRELAKRLGWSWVSTGAFYRGLAFVAYKLQVDMHNPAKILALVDSPDWTVEMNVEKTRVKFLGLDVTDEISKEEVGNYASVISQYPEVRSALLKAQRRCVQNVKGLVAEGRDCGTVVFPTAHVKIFLTARAEDRAARRAKEQGKDVKETRDAQKLRDSQDATRKAAPMAAAADSYQVDTSEMDLVEVVSTVESLVRKKLREIPR